jgi:pimeloyl-ACP methyl ester carboxylesterase
MASIRYRTADVDGFQVFYREAGPADAPKLLLLHGFPSASHMFRDLMPLLADRFHIAAPDLPGFGRSDMPPRAFKAHGVFTELQIDFTVLRPINVTRFERLHESHRLSEPRL